MPSLGIVHRYAHAKHAHVNRNRLFQKLFFCRCLKTNDDIIVLLSPPRLPLSITYLQNHRHHHVQPKPETVRSDPIDEKFIDNLSGRVLLCIYCL